MYMEKEHIAGVNSRNMEVAITTAAPIWKVLKLSEEEYRKKYCQSFEINLGGIVVEIDLDKNNLEKRS